MALVDSLDGAYYTAWNDDLHNKYFLVPKETFDSSHAYGAFRDHDSSNNMVLVVVEKALALVSASAFPLHALACKEFVHAFFVLHSYSLSFPFLLVVFLLVLFFPVF